MRTHHPALSLLPNASASAYTIGERFQLQAVCRGFDFTRPTQVLGHDFFRRLYAHWSVLTDRGNGPLDRGTILLRRVMGRLPFVNEVTVDLDRLEKYDGFCSTAPAFEQALARVIASRCDTLKQLNLFRASQQGVGDALHATYPKLESARMDAHSFHSVASGSSLPALRELHLTNTGGTCFRQYRNGPDVDEAIPDLLSLLPALQRLAAHAGQLPRAREGGGQGGHSSLEHVVLSSVRPGAPVWKELEERLPESVKLLRLECDHTIWDGGRRTSHAKQREDIKELYRHATALLDARPSLQLLVLDTQCDLPCPELAHLLRRHQGRILVGRVPPRIATIDNAALSQQRAAGAEEMELCLAHLHGDRQQLVAALPLGRSPSFADLEGRLQWPTKAWGDPKQNPSALDLVVDCQAAAWPLQRLPELPSCSHVTASVVMAPGDGNNTVQPITMPLLPDLELPGAKKVTVELLMPLNGHLSQTDVGSLELHATLAPAEDGVFEGHASQHVLSTLTLGGKRKLAGLLCRTDVEASHGRLLRLLLQLRRTLPHITELEVSVSTSAPLLIWAIGGALCGGLLGSVEKLALMDCWLTEEEMSDGPPEDAEDLDSDDNDGDSDGTHDDEAPSEPAVASEPPSDTESVREMLAGCAGEGEDGSSDGGMVQGLEHARADIPNGALGAIAERPQHIRERFLAGMSALLATMPNLKRVELNRSWTSTFATVERALEEEGVRRGARIELVGSR